MSIELPGEEVASTEISHAQDRGITSQFEAFVREAREAFRTVFAPNENPDAKLHIAVTVENRSPSGD